MLDKNMLSVKLELLTEDFEKLIYVNEQIVNHMIEDNGISNIELDKYGKIEDYRVDRWGRAD